MIGASWAADEPTLKEEHALGPGPPGPKGILWTIFTKRRAHQTLPQPPGLLRRRAPDSQEMHF